jgi:DNA-binding transcriptional MerR regulator
MQIDELEFSSTEVAKHAGVPYQTLISWEGAKILRPSLRRRKGQRRYTVVDLVAAMMAEAAFSQGFPGKAVREIVKMAQKANEEQQRNAAIVAYRSETPGFMRQAWYPDVNDPESASEIEQLRKDDLILDEATVYNIIQAMMKTIHEKYLDEKMAGTTLETE